MNQKFGGRKLPTGTPSLAWSSVVVVVSLLAGASVVHNLYKPDLTLPPVDVKQAEKECAHTIGQARCVTFRSRLYANGSDIESNFADSHRRNCPSDANNGDSNLAPLDLVTPNSFDYNYYKNLIQKKGLLASDQVLFSGGSQLALN